MQRYQRTICTLITVFLVFSLLLVIQVIPQHPLLLFERLHKNGGWFQIVILSLFAGFLFWKMYDRKKRAYWRKFAWLLFAVFFFSQLLLGLFADSVFLLTGKLHFPIPSMIAGGAIYRREIGFMPLLFLSTVLLSGGAWCSQLCYFGAFDAMASRTGSRLSFSTVKRNRIRHTVFFFFIALSIIFSLFGFFNNYINLIAASAGITGLLVLILSFRKKRMIHCTYYCPLGLLTGYLKFLSPFSFKINMQQCTQCMRCTSACSYNALQPEDIKKGRPSPLVCTSCGDCLPHCNHNALEYRFFRFNPAKSELVWLITTITLYTVFFAVARI